jgi:hypothetical protein
MHVTFPFETVTFCHILSYVTFALLNLYIEELLRNATPTLSYATFTLCYVLLQYPFHW